LKNFTFVKFAPRAFYFPEGTSACEYNDKITEIAKKNGIEHLILKDEYDFDIRPIIPYAVMPVGKQDQLAVSFMKNQGNS